MMTDRDTKFAEQEGSNGGDRLLAAQQCVKAEQGAGFLDFWLVVNFSSPPAFLFFAVIFPGTKRLHTHTQALEERLGVPGDFYSIIEKVKSFAPGLPAPGYICLSLSTRKTPELLQLRLEDVNSEKPR